MVEKLSSNGGVLILREIERELGLAAVLSRHIPDDRDCTRITQSYSDMTGERGCSRLPAAMRTATTLMCSATSKLRKVVACIEAGLLRTGVVAPERPDTVTSFRELR
jgi:hypothetical protein